MISLTSTQRRALRARAHALNPVVSIGDKGLSQSVVREIESSLYSHDLIKIRANESDRDARNAMLSDICEKLDAAPVQHIGKILVIYRKSEKPASTTPRKRSTPNKTHRTKRSHQG